jgi:phage replication-related protein YjqB (UPF0714/DUF867 family)
MRWREGGGTMAAVVADTYCSNTDLYKDPGLKEGVDYARRFRRREVFDDCLTGKSGIVRTTIIAPHGGAIEPGTSELCLAVAGYHPATLEVTPPGRVTYDYWMFEGIRSADNSQLHVTSTHCDDTVALSLCAGALNVLAQHGCTTAQAGLEDGARAVLVGGRNALLKRALLEAFAAVGIRAIDAIDRGAINGDDQANIANRTLLGMGGHLEITGPLRETMFEVNTREDRKNTTTQVFWDFVTACRSAVAQIEADQAIL